MASLAPLASYTSRLNAACADLERIRTDIGAITGVFTIVTVAAYNDSIKKIGETLRPVEEALALSKCRILPLGTLAERGELIRAAEAATAAAIRALGAIEGKLEASHLTVSCGREVSDRLNEARALKVQSSKNCEALVKNLESITATAPPSGGAGGGAAPARGLSDLFAVLGTPAAASVICTAEVRGAPAGGTFEIRGDFSGSSSWASGIRLRSTEGFSSALQAALAEAITRSRGKESFEFKLVHVVAGGTVTWAKEASSGEGNLSSRVVYQDKTLKFHF